MNVPQINREELAWAAGFFDGEGHVSYRNGALTLEVAQKDTRVLERFQQAVLGVGKINGPYRGALTLKGYQSKDYWTFKTSNYEHTQAAMIMLWSFLSPVKKEQAFKALSEAKINRKHSSYKRAKYNNIHKTKYNTWRATCRIDGMVIRVGTYDTEEIAYAAQQEFLNSIGRLANAWAVCTGSYPADPFADSSQRSAYL